MTNKEQLTAKLDALIDSYHAMGTGPEELHNMLAVRRDIAVTCYSLSSYVKETHGKAGLSNLQRKWITAKAIVDARNMDAKAKPTPMNVLEVQAQQLPEVVKAYQDEIMAESEKEALKTKLQFATQVLSSLMQEIAVLSSEARTAHFQNAQS